MTESITYSLNLSLSQAVGSTVLKHICIDSQDALREGLEKKESERRD